MSVALVSLGERQRASVLAFFGGNTEQGRKCRRREVKGTHGFDFEMQRNERENENLRNRSFSHRSALSLPL